MKDLKQNKPILAFQVFNYPNSNEELFELISSDAVLVRADYQDENNSFDSLMLTSGIKIFALRSENHGGKYKGDLKQRHAILLRALLDYDVIELELSTDLTDELLLKIPPHRRQVSWHGYARDYIELKDKFHELLNTEARFYRLVNKPKSIADCLLPLKLIKEYPIQNLTTYSSGAIGVWSQVLSAFLGSTMIYGNLNREFEADQFLTCEQLKVDYNLPQLRNIKTIYGIAGNPVFTSMSPLIHNKCYEYLEMDALYLPFHIDRFEDFWQFISKEFVATDLGLQLGGFTMVSPFKEESFKVAKGHLSNPTLTSKACNILVLHKEQWYSDSSDGLGVLTELEKLDLNFEKSKIAIIGCGGAGRTIAARIKSKGGEIIFFNRSVKRGLFASNLLNLPFKSISEFNPSEFDVVINATPVGKSGKKLIFDPSLLRNDSVTIDMAYTKKDTLLVTGCRKNNKSITEGKQILLHQVKKQFFGLTGKKMPFEVELMVRDKTENRIKVE